MLRPLLAAVAAALVLAAPAEAAPYDDDAYWAFADSMQQRVDDHWDEQDGYFHLGGGGSEPMSNSMQLLTYSVAAMQGHEGPARNDHRARILADRLVSGAPVRDQEDRHRPDPRARLGELDDQRAPAASTSSSTPRSWMVSTYAYRAREALQLPDGDRDEDPQRDPPHRPRLLLALPDDPPEPDQLVRADVRRRRDRDRRQHPAQAGLLPAARRASSPASRGSASRAGNFGPGMRFHYLPGPPINGAHEPRLRRVREHRPDLHALLRPGAARGHAGAERAPPRSVMHEWITRAVSGYWTHAGYMNWDSGLGFQRWHQGKKLGLTQEALIGLASSDSLLPGKQWGQWSKSMLDNGFDFYARLAARSPERPRRPRPVRRNRGPAGPQQRLPGRLAHRRPTPPARSTPASARRPPATPAAAVLLRPRHRPPRRDHAHLQHRRRRRQPERLPVRRPRSRAPVRRPAGGRGEHRRPPARLVRPARPRRRRPPGHRLAARPRPRRARVRGRCG